VSNDDIINLGEGDLVPLANQLTHTIHAGLPLESGLRVLAQQTRGRRARLALLHLSDALERGVALPIALKESVSGLPRPMRLLVSVGLETGQMSNLMRYCIEREGRAAALRRQIWLTLSYPLFLVWSAWVLCGAILTLVVPQFRKIFDDFGAVLPGVTDQLFAVSSFAIDVMWVPWLILTCGYWLVILAVMGTSWGRRAAIHLPILHHIFRYAVLSDLCAILALFTESNTRLERAMSSAGDATEDLWIRRECHSFADLIQNGVPAERAIASLNFPHGLIHAFHHASDQKAFAESLRQLADLYQARCLVETEHFNAIITPFAIGIVLSLATISEAAIVLPMIKLLNDLA